MSLHARTAVRWLAWISGVALVVVVATGGYAMFRYRPDATGTTLAVQRMHAWFGYVLGAAAVTIIALVVPTWARRLVAVAVAVFVALFVFTVALGARLQWDQVALWAVTAGAHVRGVLFRDLAVKFVLVNGHEYSRGEFRGTLWLHAAFVPAAMAGVLAVAMVWSRRLRRQSAETPAAIRA